MEIQFSKSPKENDINYLTEKINTETVEFGYAYPFGFFIKDDKNNIMAGANGFVIYGKIYTDQLWVDPKHRKKGLATRLMNQVHEFGVKESCFIATISTMSFQKSEGFYKKLGYEVEFKRQGHTNNSSCLFMKKKLQQ
jgi:GNAT superfamily N-acetyltransferase